MYYNLEQVEEMHGTVSSLFEKYQKNSDAISEEDKNGKYKNAFAKLRRDILYAMAQYAIANALSVYVPEGSTLTNDAAAVVNKNLPAIMHTLWTNGLEDAFEKADEVRNIFLTEFYFKSAVA